MPVEAAYYDNLDESFNRAWQQLARATKDRRHGFHDIQIATVDAVGLPSLRTVVLRAVDAVTATLRFHTDARSSKVAELLANPAVAVHAYDAQRKLQLRLSGRASLHSDDALADVAWAESHAMSRVCYRVQPAPGEPLDAPGGFTHAVSEDSGDDPGRGVFTAVVVHVESLEWLYLAASGHRRARWTRNDATWSGQWLVP